MLDIDYSPHFKRDYKRCERKHLPMDELDGVIRLIAANTEESVDELVRHHGMHALVGRWKGAHECHVANMGDWLIIWYEDGETAYLERTGTHDELFR